MIEATASEQGAGQTRVERWAVAILLLAMAILPACEIVARTVFKTAIPGAIVVAQHLTVWVGFLGALLASGSGKHLALSTGALLPPGKFRAGARIYVGALSAGVCALLAVASVKMARVDAQSDRILIGFVPEWWSELVMPAAFALIALRFVWRSADSRAGRLAAFVLAAVPAALALAPDLTPFVVPGILAILLGVVLGAPIFVAFAGAAMLLFLSEGGTIVAVPIEVFRLVASPMLPAIPLLTAAGYILAEGGASKRFLRLARALVGWAPGGMALMVVFVCAGFTTFTGGSGVTILALGGLVLPMLIAEKYPEGFSLGLVTSSGSLGLLFPPSLPVILYAFVARASAEELFVAGFVPSILLVLLVAGYAAIVGFKRNAPRHPFSLREAMAATWEAKWELAIPAIVIIAIFTGVATLVEAASLAVVAAIVSQVFIFKEIHWRRDLPGTLARGATLVGAVLLLLGVAMGLTSWLVEAEIPSALLEWTQAHIQSPIVFLLAMNAVLLVLGSVLEIYAAIAILAPLLVPMAAAYNIDPVHMGVIFLVNLELGFLFPPMGLNLILSSSRFSQPLPRLYKVALPFLAIMAVGVLLITYVPQMTTGVLDWVKPNRAKIEKIEQPEDHLFDDDDDRPAGDDADPKKDEDDWEH